MSKKLSTLSSSTADDYDESNDDNVITITRSDACKHDVNNVLSSKSYSEARDEGRLSSSTMPAFNLLDLNSINSINDTNSSSSSNNYIGGNDYDDAGSISIKRSDGKHHDISLTLNSSSNNDGYTGSKHHPNSLRIVHISDTLNRLSTPIKHNHWPVGEILVHSGNFTSAGTSEEYQKFNDWLESAKSIYHYRIVVLGNRDTLIYNTQYEEMKKMLSNATYVLCHEQCTLLGINFYGEVPATKTYLSGSRKEDDTTRYDSIPLGIHVLVTHAAAYGILDCNDTTNTHAGNTPLADAVKEVKPRLHLHGSCTSRGYVDVSTTYLNTYA